MKSWTASMAATLLLSAGMVIAGAAEAHAASGGGCSSNIAAGNGFVLKSCIANDKGYAKPTAYITTTGTPTANCETYVVLQKNQTTVTTRYYDGCKAGTYPGTECLSCATTAGTYRTGIYVTFSPSSSTYTVGSPNLTLP